MNLELNVAVNADEAIKKLEKIKSLINEINELSQDNTVNCNCRCRCMREPRIKLNTRIFD
ncbi:hypothetical protein [Mammaliicoccus sciuri]|uniref:hypothetical protein n=1 Tax=Mammaliicoccus sciuri TaxID=1296 RepID=UPI001626EA29|nr:hypothetical protein [Mammaliicoccus sciuri]